MKINNRWLFLLSLLALSMLHLWFAVQSGDYFSGDDFAVLAYFKTHSVYSGIPDFLSHGDIWGFRKITGYIFFAGFFTAYQIMTAINRVFLPASHPYALAWPGSAALSYYISPLILVFLFFLAFLSRAKTGIFLFAAFVLSLLPVLFLAHRQEDYYFYLPLAILSLFLGFTLTRLTVSTAAVYMAVFFIMGGRHIFPPLARTRYPNWQLVSINQVIDNIRFNLKSASASASIAFSDMRLERDANLMLGSQVGAL